MNRLLSLVGGSSLVMVALIVAAGCGDDDEKTDAGPGADAAPDGSPDGGDGGPSPVCEEPTDPPCIDEMIVDLSLHGDMVSEGAVTTQLVGEDWVTTVDATAGGFGQSANNPWVYVRLTEEGAARIDIDDETALESMEWHLSLRRFIIRLNGGTSGPSCVGAVSFLERTYESLTEVPEGLEYLLDEFYTGDCTFVNDSSGLPGSPQVALGLWWEYPGCVVTTGHPHLVRLEDGRIVKLVVDSYYEDPADQEICNETEAAPGDAVSAVYTIRWRFVR